MERRTSSGASRPRVPRSRARRATASSRSRASARSRVPWTSTQPSKETWRVSMSKCRPSWAATWRARASSGSNRTRASSTVRSSWAIETLWATAAQVGVDVRRHRTWGGRGWTSRSAAPSTPGDRGTGPGRRAAGAGGPARPPHPGTSAPRPTERPRAAANSNTVNSATSGAPSPGDRQRLLGTRDQHRRLVQRIGRVHARPGDRRGQLVGRHRGPRPAARHPRRRATRMRCRSRGVPEWPYEDGRRGHRQSGLFIHSRRECLARRCLSAHWVSRLRTSSFAPQPASLGVRRTGPRRRWPQRSTRSSRQPAGDRDQVRRVPPTVTPLSQ